MALYLSRTHGISRIGSFDRLRTSSEFRRSESRGGGVAFGSTLKLDRSYEGDNQRYHTTSLSRIIGKLGLAMNFSFSLFLSLNHFLCLFISGIHVHRVLPAIFLKPCPS